MKMADDQLKEPEWLEEAVGRIGRSEAYPFYDIPLFRVEASTLSDEDKAKVIMLAERMRIELPIWQIHVRLVNTGGFYAHVEIDDLRITLRHRHVAS